MKCPKCESENTQRLEVTYHGGTQNISTTSNSAGVGFSGGRIGIAGGVTKTSGQSQSTLAAACAPPAKKTNMVPVLGIIFGMISLSSGQMVSIIWGLAILGISGYFYYSRYQFNSQEWPKLYQHWSKSWICHKCGGIYHQA